VGRPVRFAIVPVLGALALSLLLSPRPAAAGGAWVSEPGQGDIQLGASRKTASTSWNVDGDVFKNLNGQGKVSYHDFRYAFLSGEVGLFKRVSTTFLVTYLDGFEGIHADPEENAGPSDAWFGLKYSLRQGSAPMAIGFTYRTPYFYDTEGPYNRHVFDSQGRQTGVSSEWRGLLKHDYTVSYMASRSFLGGRGWGNIQTGYTWRQGAPADEIPVWADLGYPLPFWGANVKGSAAFFHSMGNDSPKQADDRFGASATNNFNDASIARVGIGFLVPFRANHWTAEVGYNAWVWGESARRYREPYLSVNRRF
jgi:hypothetical protein